MNEDETDAIERWRRFAADARDSIAPGLGGRVVRTAGDGLLMEFPDAPAAAAAALALHERIAQDNPGRPAGQAMLLRMGLHLTEMLVDLYEVYGSGVNLAARLASLAQPGQTVVSEAARQGLVDGLHVQVQDLGLRFVKHWQEPIRAFRIEPPQGAGRSGEQLPLPSADDLLPAVAVVPFAGMPAEGVSDALGHAMADDIIAALSRHAGLRVLSRATTATLGGVLQPPRQLHALLGASFLVTGRYYRNDARVRLNVELCELPDGQVLWAGTATASVDDLFAGQDELVPHVVSHVGRQVLARELARVRGLPMDTLASYTLYLGATGLLNSLIRADFLRAREVLEHLSARHPRQAAPYAMLARWHVFQSVQGWSSDRLAESLSAREQARRAMDLDPKNPIALTTEGLTRLSFDNDMDGARDCYLQALAEDPQETYAWCSLAAVLSQAGEHDEACAAASRALALSPLDPNRFLFEAYAAMAALGAAQFVQAVTHAQASLRHHALHAPTHRLLIGALWLAGRHADARVAAGRYLELQPNAVVGPRWRDIRGQHRVWNGEFSDALRHAGLPA